MTLTGRRPLGLWIFCGGVLCFAVGQVHAQAFPGGFGGGRLQWQGWDVKVPGAKRAVLARLGICLDERTQLNRFHFVDVDADDTPDIIYSGPKAYCSEYGEGELTIVFLNRGGRARRVFSDNGVVTALARPTPRQAVWLTVERVGCCADPNFSIGFYRPRPSGDTLAYDQYERIASVDGVRTPRRPYPRPLRVRVTQPRYLLRLTPEIDDTTRHRIWSYDEPRGNAIAEYGAGAMGTAYAGARDRTGREWLFVLMDLAPPPTRFPGDNPPEAPARYFGWMSSRYLAIAPAAGPPQDDAQPRLTLPGRRAQKRARDTRSR
jgi:hypothetical protein